MPTEENISEQINATAIGDYNTQIINSTLTAAPVADEDLISVPFPKAGGSISVARMMRASSSPVPFEDRSRILKGLVSWAHRTDRFLVQIIGGAGGTGKTRLGIELCRQLSTTSEEETPGWKTGFLKNKASDGAIKSLTSLSEARLVVVDYAESRREQVATLLRACISSDSTAPIRIVLLVRKPRSYIADDRGAAAWVNAVRPDNDEAIDQLLDEAENTVLLLDRSPLKLKDRESLFRQATNVFAVSQLDHGIDSKIDLSGDLYEQPLMIIIAAYLHEVGGERNLTTETEMFESILHHEAKYWQHSAQEQRLKLTDDELAELVAVATLTGVAGTNEATRVLALIPNNSPREAERSREWLTKLYQHDSSVFWGPLEPDRLGEHLVATRLARYPGVLEWALTPSRDPEQLVRPLTVIARAAGSDAKFRHVVSQTINESIVGLTQRAIDIANDPHQYDIPSILPDALSGVVQSFSSEIEIEDLRRVSNMLPEHNHLLSGFAAQVSATLVESYRTLAEANPAAYLPDLAISLNNLGMMLSELGLRKEALPPTQEAVDIRRALAETNPAAYLPYLAMSLNNLGARLSELGLRKEALPPTQEAVDLRRVLAEANPAAYLPDLAMSLNNLGAMLSELGLRKEALPPTQEAVDIRRVLAEIFPAVCLPALSRSLRLLEYILTSLERNEEAHEIKQELEDIRQKLAELGHQDSE